MHNSKDDVDTIPKNGCNRSLLQDVHQIKKWHSFLVIYSYVHHIILAEWSFFHSSVDMVSKEGIFPFLLVSIYARSQRVILTTAAPD